MTTTFSQTTYPPQPKRFTVHDYHRLIELGFWGEDDHIELIRGELIQMAAKGATHESCITRLMRALLPLIGEQATLRCQSPIVLADSEPEPDFTIVRNQIDDYMHGHPRPEDTLLVIEVADSSLTYDREEKLPLYAEVGIPDYWLFNLLDGYLEAYSQPAEIRPGQFGYLNRNIVQVTASISLPPFPDQIVQLSQVFPSVYLK
jgi:Uma2 family endonuclease